MTLRIESLTGLRFFAAAAIVFWHSQADDLFGSNAFAPFVLSGAVAVFFVLSGYVLAVNAAKYRSWPDFFVARVARVWPAHAAAILLWGALFYPATVGFVLVPANARDLALNLALLQSWSPHIATFWSYNAPSWSVSCELFFYAMFPICLWAMLRRPILTLTAILAGGVAFLYGVPAVWPTLNPLWVGYINPVVNLPLFALGIATGLLHLRLPPTRTGLVTGTALQLAAIALALWGNVQMPIYGQGLSQPAAIQFMSTSGAAWTYAILIFALGRWRGLPSIALSHRALVYLGEVSYAIYLVHQLLFRWRETHRDLFAVNVWLQYAGVWMAILGLAIAIHHGIERPMQRGIKGLWRRMTGGKERIAVRPERQGIDGVGSISSAGHGTGKSL